MSLRKFIIERDIPSVGSFEREQLKGAAAQSNKALKELGPDIQCQESYVAADKNRPDDAPLGFIPVDSIFSPVERVGILVEDTRQREMQPLEKVKAELSQQMQQQNLKKFFDEMKAKAKIDIVPDLIPEIHLAG